MRVDHIEAILRTRRPRFIYTMPSLHNPTGVTLSEERRERLVMLARRWGVPLVEDDPYGELAQSSLAPLIARGSDDVIYLSSFSKTIAPSLRLGWMVAPRTIYDRLLLRKQSYDMATSMYIQAGVDDFMRTAYDAHLRALRVGAGRAPGAGERGDRAVLAALAARRSATPTATTCGRARRANSARARCWRAPSGAASRSCSAKPFFAQGGGDHHIRLALTPVPREAIEEGHRAHRQRSSKRDAGLAARLVSRARPRASAVAANARSVPHRGQRVHAAADASRARACRSTKRSSRPSPILRRWRRPMPATPCGCGAAWATIRARCACTRWRARSSNGTAARLPSDRDGAARAAGDRPVHGVGRARVRVRARRRRARHERPPHRAPHRLRPRASAAGDRRANSTRARAAALVPGTRARLEFRHDGRRRDDLHRARAEMFALPAARRLRRRAGRRGASSRPARRARAAFAARSDPVRTHDALLARPHRRPSARRPARRVATHRRVDRRASRVVPADRLIEIPAVAEALERDGIIERTETMRLR